MIINTATVIEDFNTQSEIRHEYTFLNNYLLYICGGDFTLFDDGKLLKQAIKDNILNNVINILEKDGIFMQQLSTEDIIVLTPVRKQILKELSELSLNLVQQFKLL